MLKNIPKFILIGAHKIEVIPTTTAEFEKMWCDGEEEKIIADDETIETIGFYDHKHNKIHLWEGLVGTRKAACLMHEILEAINWQNDLNLNHIQLSTLTESILALLLFNDLDFKVIRQE